MGIVCSCNLDNEQRLETIKLKDIKYLHSSLFEAYCGLMISSLTTTIDMPRIETFEELADSDYYIYATSGNAPTNLLLQANSSSMQRVAETWKGQTSMPFIETKLERNFTAVMTIPKVRLARFVNPKFINVTNVNRLLGLTLKA